ncbi:hypothetical protein TNCV_3762531 [Trichonephila clavipes]|nr:hypothetical protein TNCV_3762531 [Trichonephila clavipes]
MVSVTEETIVLWRHFDLRPCRKNNSTRPLSSKIKANAGRKTTQLVSRNETTQLNEEKTTQLGNMNETTQQEKTTQLSSRNETAQLVSRNETTQLCTAVDRLQPPATACTAFTAESAFSTYCSAVLVNNLYVRVF